MPAVALIAIGAGAAWIIGRSVDDAGTGALKLAVAGAIGAGTVLMLKRAGVV